MVPHARARVRDVPHARTRVRDAPHLFGRAGARDPPEIGLERLYEQPLPRAEKNARSADQSGSSVSQVLQLRGSQFNF